MAEQLLSQKAAAARLGICDRAFRNILPNLIAAGMQFVTIPGRGKIRPMTRYREASLDKMIARAADKETALCP